MGHRLIRLVLGEVVGVHIAESLLEEGIYQTAKAQPILRAGGPTAYYAISDSHRFDWYARMRAGNMRATLLPADQQFCRSVERHGAQPTAVGASLVCSSWRV